MPQMMLNQRKRQCALAQNDPRFPGIRRVVVGSAGMGEPVCRACRGRGLT
jgi:hypothetical protein